MDRRATIQGIWEQQTGTLQPLGQITGAGGTAVYNSTTAVPFPIPLGARIVLQLVAGTLPVAWVASPDVDSGAVLTPTTAGPYPQFASVGQMIATCLFGGGGQGTGNGQGSLPTTPTVAVATIGVVSAAAFTVNVYRLR
jgi:hypothetical protein